jgi:hypothetical protein
MADPRKGTILAMTMMCIAAAIKTSIAPLAVTMTKGKAPTTMMMICLHKEQKEAIVAAKISHRTVRVKDGVTLRHPHQGAPMAAAVVAADQQGHATLARIRQTRSPRRLYTSKQDCQVSNSLLPWPKVLWTTDS